jgi:geranylgeranyl diphosphate synthase type II
MGAITAHASESQIRSLSNLGMEMGIAFQIQDDLLDVTADPKKFGKRVGGDIYEGKKTYLTILTLERANDKEKKIIETVLADQNATEKDINTVLQLMKKYEVLSDIAKEVDDHYESAINSLNNFLESDFKQELKNLLIFLKNRDH